MYFETIERDDRVYRPAGATFLEFEDPEHFQLLQIRVDIGNVTIDETDDFAHALRIMFGDRLDELQT